MDREEIYKTARILASTETAQWKDLYYKLGISSCKIQLTIIQYEEGILPRIKLFMEILSEWVHIKGPSATKENLCETLNLIGWEDCSEKILRLLSGRAKPATRQSPTNVTISFDLNVSIFIAICLIIMRLAIRSSQPELSNLSMANFGINQNKILFRIPRVTPGFCGRAKQLEELETLFGSRIRTPLLTVVGMGGVGKSELVKQFVKVISDYANCIWLQGDSDESLKESIIQLAEVLEVSVTQMGSLQDLIAAADSKIKKTNHLPAIVIIDNLRGNSKLAVSVIKILTRLSYFVIVTSNSASVLDFAGEIMILDVFTTEEAMSFVRASFPDESENNIEQLCQSMDNFPLALKQAVAFIQIQKFNTYLGQSYSVSSYLNEVLETKDENNYLGRTLSTVTLTADKIKNTEMGTIAIDLLNLLAYLESDKIQMRFVQVLCAKAEDLETAFMQSICQDAILLLKDYSLIKIENNYISIHHLVQEGIRMKCSFTDTETNILVKWMGIADELLYKISSPDIIHIVSLSTYCSKYAELIKLFGDSFLRISLRLRDLLMYRRQLIFTNTTFIQFKTILGEDDILTLQMEEQMATALEINGRYEESYEKFNTVYQKQQGVLGSDHLTTLKTGNKLAAILNNLDRTNDAFELLQHLLNIESNVLGENHEITLLTQHQIGILFTKEGKYLAAVKTFEDVFDLQKTTIGEDHPDSLNTLHSKAVCVLKQGNLPKARVLFEQIRQRKTQIIGAEHPETLITKYMLAWTLHRLGENQQALKLMETVLLIQEKILGHDHPVTIRTRKVIPIIKHEMVRQDHF